MKFYLNYGNQWKSGVFGHMPEEINDEVEIILPDGFKVIKNVYDEPMIEHPDGQLTLQSEILTEHVGATAVPYIMDCAKPYPKKIYLKAVKKTEF